MRLPINAARFLPALLCWVFLTAGAALAQSPGAGFDSLTPHLPASGQDETWRFVNTGDSFEIENIGDPGAIRYYFVAPAPGTEGRRRIEAGVSIHPESKGAAGLLYGLNATRDLYHLVTLDAQGVLTIYRRDSSGFRALSQQSSDAFSADGVNHLVLEEEGDTVAVSLNGTKMGAVGGDRFGFGGTGLGAVGDVRALFTFFSDGS
ncbi:MAG: hypothetical protein EP318_15720 [Rhodobacteraceae bacterium]|nr:MAG: hypothetical protein EP318_15720 [Paracoccaceae bacterium]